jgi:hypothetical protein
VPARRISTGAAGDGNALRNAFEIGIEMMTSRYWKCGKSHITRKELNIMTTMTKFLAGCMTVALPFAAAAQANDAGYCSALSNTYRHTAPKGAVPTVSIPVAMAQCAAGNTAGGIPVLEQALRNAKVTLPPRA